MDGQMVSGWVGGQRGMDDGGKEGGIMGGWKEKGLEEWMDR